MALIVLWNFRKEFAAGRTYHKRPASVGAAPVLTRPVLVTPQAHAVYGKVAQGNAPQTTQNDIVEVRDGKVVAPVTMSRQCTMGPQESGLLLSRRATYQ